MTSPDNILKFTTLLKNADFKPIQEALEADQARSIGVQNWEPHQKGVQAEWKCLWGKDAFFLYFEVSEPWVRACHKGYSGGVVCQDSCIEWFFSINGVGYYNFEFNPIGAFTIMKGDTRKNRYSFKAHELPGLRFLGSEGHEPFDAKPGEQPWKAWMVIPYNICDTHVEQLRSSSLKANFYKCGDALPTRHYLSWAPIATENPDFHRPEFFKELILEKL
jgi:hypothetical protein